MIFNEGTPKTKLVSFELETSENTDGGFCGITRKYQAHIFLNGSTTLEELSDFSKKLEAVHKAAMKLSKARTYYKTRLQITTWGEDSLTLEEDSWSGSSYDTDLEGKTLYLRPDAGTAEWHDMLLGKNVLESLADARL